MKIKRKSLWHKVNTSGRIVHHAGHSGNDEINVPIKT
jgi:hypothetical protein